MKINKSVPIILKFTVLFVLLSIQQTLAATVQLPQTGQISCWDAGGNVISCAGTGQDGDKRAGMAWPDPRFTDNGNGTVKDNQTGLIWTKDGNAPGPSACGPGTTKTWQGALDYVACLNSNNYLNYSDWRLPNRKELKSLVNRQPSNPAAWLNGLGFSNVNAWYYWSSSTSAEYTTEGAWFVRMDNPANVSFWSKSEVFYVWPVRGEALQMPKTGQTSSYAAGDDGALQKGAVWPAPRFTNNGNGTVKDNLTGLTWLQNANCTDTAGGISKANGRLVWANALIWSNNLASGACGLSDNSMAGDWRLPNIVELESLVDLAKYNPALPAGHPFSNVPPTSQYWSSTTRASGTLTAYTLGMSGGYVSYSYKDDNWTYVWPVRGGQSGSLNSLVISKSGTGSGTVTSDPAGINCGATCSALYSSGTSVILTATEASGSTFTGWSGSGCSGTGTCTVTMNSPQSVTANYMIKGDINNDGIVTIADAILALRVLSGLSTAGLTLTSVTDINSDGKVGLAEVIYILQKLTGMR